MAYNIYTCIVYINTFAAAAIVQLFLYKAIYGVARKARLKLLSMTQTYFRTTPRPNINLSA